MCHPMSFYNSCQDLGSLLTVHSIIRLKQSKLSAVFTNRLKESSISRSMLLIMKTWKDLVRMADDLVSLTLTVSTASSCPTDNEITS